MSETCCDSYVSRCVAVSTMKTMDISNNWTWHQLRRPIECQLYDLTLTVGGLKTTQETTNLGDTCPCAVCGCVQRDRERNAVLAQTVLCLSLSKGYTELPAVVSNCRSCVVSVSTWHAIPHGSLATGVQGSSYLGETERSRTKLRKEPLARRKPQDRDHNIRPSQPNSMYETRSWDHVTCEQVTYKCYMSAAGLLEQAHSHTGHTAVWTDDHACTHLLESEHNSIQV